MSDTITSALFCLFEASHQVRPTLRWSKLSSTSGIVDYQGISQLFFVCSLPHHMACGILVSQSGIEPAPLAVKAWSPNHWTTREFPVDMFLNHHRCPLAKELLWWMTHLRAWYPWLLLFPGDLWCNVHQRLHSLQRSFKMERQQFCGHRVHPATCENTKQP